MSLDQTAFGTELDLVVNEPPPDYTNDGTAQMLQQFTLASDIFERIAKEGLWLY